MLYEASEYSNQATQGSAYKKFEDGTEYSLAWVSGGPLFLKGGALRIGHTAKTEDADSSCNSNNCSGPCKNDGFGNSAEDECGPNGCYCSP